MGYHTLVVDIDPAAEGFYYAAEHRAQSAYDHDAIINGLEKSEAAADLCGVITQAARGCIPTVARISEYYGLPCLSSRVAELSQDKSRLTRMLNPDDVLGTYDSPESIPSEMEYPLVVKWEGSSGGSGVHLVRSGTEMDNLKDYIPDDREIIIESYISGRHFGVMGLANGSTLKIYGIAEKFQREDLTLDRVVFPAELEDELEVSILRYTKRVLEQLDFDFGPFQLELIVGKNERLFFVELEPSALGSYLSELLIPQTSANDMIRDSIQLVCKGIFEEAVQPAAFRSILKYHYPDELGTLKSISLVNPQRRIQYRPFFSVGERLADKRMYSANTLIVGTDLDQMTKLIDSQVIHMDVQA